jgi:hypothetical protein
VSRDEYVAAMVKLPGLTIDRQIPQDGLIRQITIEGQGRLSRRTNCAYNRAAHSPYPLCELR